MDSAAYQQFSDYNEDRVYMKWIIDETFTFVD